MFKVQTSPSGRKYSATMAAESVSHPERKTSKLETHFQSLVLSLILALLIGGFTKINTMGETLVRLEERDKVRSESQAQVQADVKAVQQQLISVNERLTKLEARRK